MATASISRAWDDTKAIFARDGRLLVAVALALIVLPALVVGLVAPAGAGSQDPTPLGQLLGLLAGLIAIVGQLALIRLAIGPATTVGSAISHGFSRFLPTFGALLLLLLIFFIVLIPLVIIMVAAGMVDASNPAKISGGGAAVILLLALVALAVSGRFLLTASVASEERVGPLTILKRSWNLTSGNYWRLMGLMLLLLIVAIILMTAATEVGGIIGKLLSPDLEPFSLGSLVLAIFTSIAQGAFTVLSSVMIARVYVQLAGRGEAEATVPNT